VSRTQVSEEVFQRPAELPELQPWADVMVALLETGSDGGLRPGERRTRLIMELVVGREVDGKRQWGVVSWSPLLPEKEWHAPTATPNDDPTLSREVVLRLPDLSSNGSAKGRTDSALTHARSSWPARPTLGDVAEALHQATGLEVLADSFVRSRVQPKWVTQRQTVAHLLDTLARELDYTWQKEDNLLFLRSRTAHWDRAMEVSEGVLRPWQKRASRPGAKPLDDYAELAAALDDLQALGMSMYWGWYLQEPWVTPPEGSAFSFYRMRRHLRFWASLNPSQRKEALSGAILSTARMTDAQRRAFVTALTDPDVPPWEPAAAFLVSRPTLTPADALSGGFSLKMAIEWNHQLFEGEKPGEDRMQIVAMYPTYRPPNIANLPQGYRWTLVGPPCAREDNTFAYYLGGEQKPVRTAALGILRPRAVP
jgi:hypothetical protein